MMNKFVLATAILLSGAYLSNAQGKTTKSKEEVTVAPAPAVLKSPRMTAQAEWGSVAYGSPSKNGRVVFGELVPFGKVWRTGANMSTDITFVKDVLVAGREVKAGTYALFTIPEAQEWTVILNPVPEQRGASQYEDNKAKNVMEEKLKVAKSNKVTEKLTMVANANSLIVSWDDVSVTIPVSVKK